MSEAPVRPEGIWCWGCARRFVYGGTPTSGPLAAIKWREGLCNKPDCGVWGSWQRWLLEQLLLVERHEACEFFVLDGERPFAPNHGPGADPYIIFSYATDIDARTSFRGIVKETA